MLSDNVSPTGKAVIPGNYVPFVAAGYTALVAFVSSLPTGGKAATYGQLALTIIGPLLGMFCPGIRSKPSA